MPSLDPTNPVPTKVGLDPVSSLCTTGHPSNILTGAWVRLLREHFSDAGNLEYNGTTETENAQLREYLWHPEIDKRRIQIDAVWKYNEQDLQRRPALYVKRNPLQYQQVAIANGMTVHALRKKGGEIEKVRGEYQVVAVIGSHTVFCIGGSGAEAELLGMETAHHFAAFSQVLRKDLKLHRLMVTEVGEVALLDEAVEHFVVPVVIAYAFFDTWRLNVESPWFKTLAIDVQG